MKYDQFGQGFTDTRELVDLLYKDPDMDFSHFVVEDPEQFNDAIEKTYAEFSLLRVYKHSNAQSIKEFDSQNQSQWWMPEEYKNLDIAEWILRQCKNDAELQRAGEELIMYQERNLFTLLSFLKYLVDTLRKENIVWGVGRGSSVASFVLYLIGVHRINSLHYDLDPREFLK
jgi:DNA polymerase III alpha subunit